MIRANQLNPNKYIEYCFNMLEKESSSLVLEFIMNSVLNTINNYIAFHNQPNYQKTYLEILQKHFYDKFLDLKNTTISIMLELLDYQNKSDLASLLRFLVKLRVSKDSTPMLLKSATSTILEEGDDIDTLNDFDLEGLSLKTRKNIVLAVFESEHLKISTKNELLEKLLGNDLDDKYFKFTLEAAQPDKEFKITIWNRLVYGEGADKSKINIAYMNGFARKSQYRLMKNYLKKDFFRDFEEVKNSYSLEYCLTFFRLLKPSFIVEDEILEKFEQLKSNLNKHDYELIAEMDKGKLNIYIIYYISH